MALARPATQGRQHPLELGRRVGASHLVHVRSRPPGRADEQVPPLRLRRAREPQQRPPDLLQGPRLPLALLRVQGGRRDLRRRAHDLPHVPQPPPGPPDTPDPLGRRGDGLPRPGTPDRRGRRARGQVPGQASLPRLGALRRLRDGRRVDVGGLPARLLLQARQPHGHPGHEPPRPDPRDDGRLARRPLRRPRRGLRLARHPDRRPQPRRDRPRLRGGPRPDR